MAVVSPANFTGRLMMQGKATSSSGGGTHCESPALLELNGVECSSKYGGVNGAAMTTLMVGIERVAAETAANPAITCN